MAERAAHRLAPGTSVHVRVPASSANLGPGFDSIGLALGLWDECTATVTGEPGLVIEVEGQGAGEVPLDERHLVYRSMLTAWDHLHPADAVEVPLGLHLRCRNAVPHGRGLGSSATAIVTGIAAAQGLRHFSQGDDRPFDLAFTNDIASMVEGHPDNASASVYGGMTLSWSDDPGQSSKAATTTVRVPLHPDVVPVVFVPSETLSTARARSVLPSHVRLADAAYNSARAALLVHAMRHDPGHLLSATQERLHQEARRASYPHSMELVDRLRREGHAAVISGAGPSVLVLATTATAEAVLAHAAEPWQALAPGVPAEGVIVRQVTP
jgi:homoserine kinase